MTPLDLLLERRSSGKLSIPAPDDAALALIVAASRRAPDHGGLAPTRLLVVSGDGLDRLARAGETALRARETDVTPKDIERAREKLTRAPMVIAIAGHIEPDHPKIPEIEQVLTVGAAGMNILNALHALGFGGKWVTGANAHDPAFAAELGFVGNDRLYGMIMVGTPDGASAPPAGEAIEGRADPSVLDDIRRWG